MASAATDIPIDELTERQKEVLQAALNLIVQNASGFTMIAVARAASCSKETLYKWFGDRDGLLATTVRFQAAKVGGVPFSPDTLDAQKLREVVEGFAKGLLSVLTGAVSVALNRVAIGQAGAEPKGLGQIVLQHGRLATGPRLKVVFEAAHQKGLIHCPDSEEAFRTFFGLVVRDTQIRLLLGEALKCTSEDILRDASRATDQFFTLYSPQKG